MGFWNTNIKNETIHKHPEKIIHEERRAPTDESIRLAKEYEDKIYSQISEKLIVNNNLFTYSMAFSKDMLAHTILHIKIKINNNEFSETFRLESFKSIEHEYISEMVRNWLCEKILMEPLMSIFTLYYSKDIFGYKIINNEIKLKETK